MALHLQHFQIVTRVEVYHVASVSSTFFSIHFNIRLCRIVFYDTSGLPKILNTKDDRGDANVCRSVNFLSPK